MILISVSSQFHGWPKSAAPDALKGAVHHVHAKDTMLNAPVQATTSLLENGGLTDVAARSWSYVTLGYGHGEQWWHAFCYRLRMAGYDGWLSIGTSC